MAAAGMPVGVRPTRSTWCQLALLLTDLPSHQLACLTHTAAYSCALLRCLRPAALLGPLQQ